MARLRLEDIVGLLMLSGDDAARGACHPYFDHCGGLHDSRSKVPSRDLIELTQGLAGRPPGRLGHDCCDRWAASKKILAAAGLTDSWGQCPAYKGDGIDPAVSEAYEAWTETDPPAGDGWQMWETVSEGSPISPVCESPEGLARWLADNKASACGADTATYEQWLGMIRRGWAPSMIGYAGALESGVAGISKLP